MQSDEQRIDLIENIMMAKLQASNWRDENFENHCLTVRALCEIARQLSRLADAYEEVHK